METQGSTIQPHTRWLKSTSATPSIKGSLLGAISNDSGRAFLDDVDAKEVIDMVSSLFTGLGGYVTGLNSRSSWRGCDIGDAWNSELCGLPSAIAREKSTNDESRCEPESELRVANDWRGS